MKGEAEARTTGEEADVPAAARALSGIQETLGYKAGHLFKRLAMIEQQFGDTAHHLGLLAAA